MAQIFISYSRVDGAFAERFVARLRRKFPNHGIWIDTEITGGDDWWAEIIKAIGSCDIFIYLLSNESVESAYCRAEFSEAQRLQKRIITVQVRDRTKITGDLSKIQYVDMKNGADDVDAQDELTRAIVRQVGLIPARRPKALRPQVTPKPDIPSESPRINNTPEVDTPELNIIPVQSPTQTQPIPTSKQRSSWMSPMVVGILLVVVLAVIILLVVQNMITTANNPTPEPTPAAFADADTPTATITNATSDTLPALTNTATDLPIELVVATLDAEAILRQPTLDAEATISTLLTEYAQMTQISVDATATATLFTLTPTPDITASIEAYRTQQAQTVTQAWIDSWTNTPTSTHTPTSTVPSTLAPTPDQDLEPTATLDPNVLEMLGTPVALLELVEIVPLSYVSQPDVPVTPIQVYLGDIIEIDALPVPNPNDRGSRLQMVRLRSGVIGLPNTYFYRIDDLPPQIIVLTTNGIVVRSAPNINASRAGAIPRNDVAVVTGIEPSGEWFFIQTGWIPVSLLDGGQIDFLGDIDEVPVVVYNPDE